MRGISLLIGWVAAVILAAMVFVGTCRLYGTSGAGVKRIVKIVLASVSVAYFAAGVYLAEFYPSALGGVHEVGGLPTVYVTNWGIFFLPAVTVHGWIRSAS